MLLFLMILLTGILQGELGDDQFWCLKGYAFASLFVTTAYSNTT